MTTPDDLIAVDDFPATPDQCAPSDKQRLRLHVPNVATTLYMGAQALRGGIRDSDGGPVSYDGFGVHTQGHVYLAAENGVAAMKAKKEVTIHSIDKTLDIRSKQNAYFGSDASTYIRGRTGTLIVGGEAPEFFPAVAPGFAHDSIFADNANPDPWNLEVLAETQALSESMASNFTQIQGIIMGISKSLAATASVVGAIPLIFGLKKAIGSLIGGHAAPSVGIHGSDGVNITTPKAVTVHAQKHVLISSGMESEVQSLVSTNIGAGVAMFVGAAGFTTLMGGYSAKLVSGKSTELSSRRGKVALRAKDIVIGDKTGEFPQVATEAIAGYAQQIAFAAEKNLNIGAGIDLTLSGKGAQLHGTGNACLEGGLGAVVYGGQCATVRSGNAVNIATSGFTFAMTNSEIAMGNIKKKWPDAPSEVPLTDLYARIAASGDDLTVTSMKAVAGEIQKENAKAWDDWVKKAEAIVYKDCGIKIGDGDIELEVKGYKFKVDSSEAKVGSALVVKK
ncbi:MAG: hypothetical protein IT378_11955 [Sandaracinaceae bacterium]|nr:hypothetical protein [Sandaracinaceae bacterium]